MVEEVGRFGDKGQVRKWGTSGSGDGSTWFLVSGLLTLGLRASWNTLDCWERPNFRILVSEFSHSFKWVELAKRCQEKTETNLNLKLAFI